jgi:YggT family protein
MTYEERRTSIVRDADPASPVVADRSVEERHVGRARPTWSTVVGRIVVIVFGVIQALIALRVLLLAIDANKSNDLVRAILDLSQVFVAPFEGILRTNAVASGGSVLDVSAIVAIVGWTLLELLVLAIIRVARPGDEV